MQWTAAELFGVRPWELQLLTFDQFEQLEKSCAAAQAEARKTK